MFIKLNCFKKFVRRKKIGDENFKKCRNENYTLILIFFTLFIRKDQNGRNFIALPDV